jgi:hypothetical protein
VILILTCFIFSFSFQKPTTSVEAEFWVRKGAIGEDALVHSLFAIAKKKVDWEVGGGRRFACNFGGSKVHYAAQMAPKLASTWINITCCNCSNM